MWLVIAGWSLLLAALAIMTVVCWRRKEWDGVYGFSLGVYTIGCIPFLLVAKAHCSEILFMGIVCGVCLGFLAVFGLGGIAVVAMRLQIPQLPEGGPCHLACGRPVVPPQSQE